MENKKAFKLKIIFIVNGQINQTTKLLHLMGKYVMCVQNAING